MKKYKYKQQIVLGYNSDGKQIRKWIYGNTKNEMALQKAELQKQYASCKTASDITFGEYADTWKDTYKSMMQPNTVEMYDNALKHTEHIRHIKVKDISATDLQSLIKDNWEHAEACKKLKMTLNEIFKRAIKDKLITDNPASELELPRVVHKPKRALTAAEKDVIRKLISEEDHTLNDRDKLFLATEYYFGLRPEEVRALTISDFKNKLSDLTIDKASAFDGEIPVIKPTKTYNRRVMPVPEAYKPLLRKYITEHHNMYLFTMLNSTSLMTKSSNTKMWKRIKEAINRGMGGTKELNVLGDNFTAYILRRTYCTTLYYSGISIKKAAYLMGHADTQMILEVYAQLDDQKENIQAIRTMI